MSEDRCRQRTYRQPSRNNTTDKNGARPEEGARAVPVDAVAPRHQTLRTRGFSYGVESRPTLVWALIARALGCVASPYLPAEAQPWMDFITARSARPMGIRPLLAISS